MWETVEQFAPWLFGISLAMFVGSLVAVPVVIVLLPTDYLVRNSRRFSRLGERHPLFVLSLLIIKNLFGALFILMGLVMLLTPGQGVLSILVGVLLLDFPGKRRLERKLLSRPGVFRLLNKIRDKAGRKPMSFPGANHDHEIDNEAE